MTIKNRRAQAQSRTDMKLCKAFVFYGERQYQIKMVDYSRGGMGVILSNRNLNKLQLVVGQKIRVRFPLCHMQHIDLFVVCTINGNRVGLKYADEKCMNPQQRITASYNKAVVHE